MIIRKINPRMHIREAGEQCITLFKTKTFIVIPAILIIISLILCLSIAARKREIPRNADNSDITYMSVCIEADDTLWSIAYKYYSEEFGSIEDYIKEIKKCNSLKSDAIYAGRHIIVPIYISDGIMPVSIDNRRGLVLYL